jgi:hypothetical protein
LQNCLRLLDCSAYDLGGRQDFVNQTNRFAGDDRGGGSDCKSTGDSIMAEGKLAPNLPGWMQEHASRYLSSDGTDRHMYTISPPGYSELTVPSLLLTTAAGSRARNSYFHCSMARTEAVISLSPRKAVRLNIPVGIATSSRATFPVRSTVRS